MKWILNYVDIELGSSLAQVEDRCLEGWEPFAITWVPIPNKLVSIKVLESNTQRFWFKKQVRGK